MEIGDENVHKPETEARHDDDPGTDLQFLKPPSSR